MGVGALVSQEQSTQPGPSPGISSPSHFPTTKWMVKPLPGKPSLHFLSAQSLLSQVRRPVLTAATHQPDKDHSSRAGSDNSWL